MYIKPYRAWELPESSVTRKSDFLSRRSFMKAGVGGSLMSAVSMSGLSLGIGQVQAENQPKLPTYPLDLNPIFTVDRALTPKKIANTYNNFYEFGSSKNIWKNAQSLVTHPWEIRVDGLVEREFTVDVDDLISRMPLEERIYRLRCVEGWSMTIPWSGFPMKRFVDMAKPLASAKYVRLETFNDKDMAQGQRQFWYPWPYVEGVTMAEATNDLAFIVTGVYGEALPKQHGAPIRAMFPWKYGFKSGKSIVKFTFTDQQPINFWQALQGNEYGFWANVNPDVPHRRWSQATERVIGEDVRIPTMIFNGYSEFVSDIYRGMENKNIWF